MSNTKRTAKGTDKQILHLSYINPKKLLKLAKVKLDQN